MPSCHPARRPWENRWSRFPAMFALKVTRHGRVLHFRLRPVAPGSPPLTDRHSSALGRQEVLAALRCHLDRLRCGKPGPSRGLRRGLKGFSPKGGSRLSAPQRGAPPTEQARASEAVTPLAASVVVVSPRVDSAIPPSGQPCGLAVLSVFPWERGVCNS